MNISSFNRELNQWRRYSVAVLAVAIALLVKLLLNSVIEQESPFLVFFAAVLVSTRYGGMRAGVLATFLAALSSDYFFLSPAYSFPNHDLGQNLQLLLFVVEGISISKIVASLNSGWERVELSNQETLHHQESLRQSEERFRLMVEDVKDYAIFIINTDGYIISWNAGAERIFGYPESEIIGQQLSCIFTPEDIQIGKPEQELRTAVAKGRADDERWHICKNGTTFWASGVLTALRDEVGNLRGFSKVVRDITERKQAEERLQKANADLVASEERLKLALRVNQASTWDWDIVTNQLSWCHNHEVLYGLTPGTFEGTHQAVLECIHLEDRQGVIQAVARAVKSRTDYDQEYRIVWPDGSTHWLAVKGKVFYDKTDQAVRMLGLSVDITTHKQTAKQVEASLKEKEVLLKEIHHRVKNNLQIISSLLNLQSGYVKDQKTLEILKQCENRVEAMALIHEQLYLSHDLAKIDFAEYVKNLAANLFSSYDVHSDAEERVVGGIIPPTISRDEDGSGGIALKLELENACLNIDAAIPCGLIINELISNSLKHAFLANKKGEICIKFYTGNDNSLTLSVSDNGIGFPKDLDFRNTESLGLQIVTALTNQLEGTIELNRSTGTEFKIKF